MLCIIQLLNLCEAKVRVKYRNGRFIFILYKHFYVEIQYKYECEPQRWQRRIKGYIRFEHALS